ncbi:MAG: tetraacyldisaccharide 4'-kinase [Pseudomonadota bacterium]
MRAPVFWEGGLDPRSREAAPLTRALLTPASALYAFSARSKRERAKPVNIGRPIICIGNLTLGGAGKTPVAAAIRDRLSAAGLRVATLSRGYGGSNPGPTKVDASATARTVGDEPLMLAGSGEAWIGRDRLAAARAMAADGVEAIVMDDGHQNHAVLKSISLIVIDTGDPVGNGYVFPKGPLREPIRDGLDRADAVVLMGERETPEILESFPGPLLRCRLAPRSEPPPGPVVAFAGIGRPEKFFDTLDAAGAEMVDAAPFPDHHRFARGDLNLLHKLAEERGAALITTEKDFVRLDPEDRRGIHVFRVAAEFENTAQLDALLAPVVDEFRG